MVVTARPGDVAVRTVVGTGEAVGWCKNSYFNLEALKEFASYCLPLLSRGLEIKVSLSLSLRIKTVSTVLVSPSRLLFIHLRSLESKM